MNLRTRLALEFQRTDASTIRSGLFCGSGSGLSRRELFRNCARVEASCRCGHTGIERAESLRQQGRPA